MLLRANFGTNGFAEAVRFFFGLNSGALTDICDTETAGVAGVAGVAAGFDEKSEGFCTSCEEFAWREIVLSCFCVCCRED